MAEPLPAFQGRHLGPASPDPCKKGEGKKEPLTRGQTPCCGYHSFPSTQQTLRIPPAVPRPDGDLEFSGLHAGQPELAREMKLIGLPVTHRLYRLARGTEPGPISYGT